jgi:hypothetical protein
MSRARNLADLLDANGDVASGALDNVPPSNDASALTTGTLPIARIADGDITAAKLGSTLDLSGKTVTLPSGLVGGFDSMQVFTASGTWTKPSGVTKVLVYVTGGGGGGGSQGVGGAGGGTAIKFIDVSAISSETVTIGQGGTAAGGTGDGGTGGTSSFGSHCSASGGNGGFGGVGSTESPASAGIGTGGDLNLRGAGGGTNRGSDGGVSFFGGVTNYTTNSPPAAGSNGGGGAGGPSGIQSQSGSGGLVVVFEYK